MSIGQIGWGLFLFGLPFSHFIFRPGLDLWHSQSLWAQGCVLTLFGLSYMGHPQRETKNAPLGAWIIWISLLALHGFTMTTVTHKVYPLVMLPSLLHWMVIVMFYQAALRSLDSMTVKRLLKAIAYAGLLVMAYCVLQLLNLDQFFSDLGGKKTVNMVGTIGNPSHLGSYLALLIPIFWLQEKRRWKVAAAAAAILCVISHSAGAIIALAGGALFYVCYRHPKQRVKALSLAFVALIGVLIFGREFISFNGRIEPWQEFYKFFQQRPITGLGTGFIFEIAKEPKLEIMRGWRHVHNEYFQVAIEQGLIGLGILIWGLVAVFKKFLSAPKTGLSICLASILVIMAINSLVNFTGHLWIIGSIPLLAYCGLHILAREEGA